ncbi:hypothetical protein BDZ97DRAFT_1923858 [Flammula alnicola]|nr:hypothetical protein BDZ97DRAFT_1923858 [Flammula alnicola]
MLVRGHSKSTEFDLAVPAVGGRAGVRYHPRDASLPVYMKKLATTTLEIGTGAKAVKGRNSSDFQHLADDASRVIATLWYSSQTSFRREAWPSPELIHIADDLSSTLDDVQLLVHERLSANTTSGIFRTMADSRRIKTYRHKLQTIISALQENGKIPSDVSIVSVLAQESEHEDSAMQLGSFRSAQKGARVDNNLVGDETDIEHRPQDPEIQHWQTTDAQQEGNDDVISAASRYKLREIAYFANKTRIRELQGNVTSHASSAAQQTTPKQSSRQPKYSKASACQQMTPSSEPSDGCTALRPPIVGPHNAEKVLNFGNNNSVRGNISISDNNNQIHYHFYGSSQRLLSLSLLDAIAFGWIFD